MKETREEILNMIDFLKKVIKNNFLKNVLLMH